MVLVGKFKGFNCFLGKIVVIRNKRYYVPCAKFESLVYVPTHSQIGFDDQCVLTIKNHFRKTNEV